MERNVTFHLRRFRAGDAAAVDVVALAAFEELRHCYDDWAAFSRMIGNMAALAESAELFVATVEEGIVGAVAYAGPGNKKPSFFPMEWSAMRMLVVAPAHRGLGIERALAQACIRRAEHDGAPLIALHTSSIMNVALPMYARMGFRFHHEAPAIFGVPYGVYVKTLTVPPAPDSNCPTNPEPT